MLPVSPPAQSAAAEATPETAVAATLETAAALAAGQATVKVQPAAQMMIALTLGAVSTAFVAAAQVEAQLLPLPTLAAGLVTVLVLLAALMMTAPTTLSATVASVPTPKLCQRLGTRVLQRVSMYRGTVQF